MTKFFAHITKERAASHAIFWLIWVCGFTFLQGFGSCFQAYETWLVYYLITLPLFVAHTYVVAYWLIPRYFFNHRYLLFAVWIVHLLILASLAELLISNELIWRWINPENIQPDYLNVRNVLINGLGNEYVVIAFLAVKVVKFWNLKIGEKTELMNRKLSAEVELLQYQSYPRFVLNVMDRLENLAENHSPQTSEMIIRLSNLMTNMTIGRKPDKILLPKEVEMIRSYIEIQRMSFPKDYQVNFLVTGELNGVQIPPFLFFQLIEEGFNQLEEYLEKPDYTILIKTEPHYLLFSMTLWNDSAVELKFNPQVLGNCHKYLDYFYPDNHKVMSNFEINFAEITIEIYL
ncbi:MAG: histidine kinase [Prolixibacteraceae bacterium]|nr:histidine kinase [Prolixibacteraceae bacterium]